MTITINDLAVFYRVGVTDEERAKPQRLVLTIEILHDFYAATKTDDLTQTIDYAAVCERLLKFGEGASWKLIETLAADIAETLIQDFGARTVSVEVKKFVVPQAQYVSVKLTRSRQS